MDDETDHTTKPPMNMTKSLKRRYRQSERNKFQVFRKSDDSLTQGQEIDGKVDLRAEINTFKQLLPSYKSSHSEIVKLVPIKDQTPCTQIERRRS